MKIVIAENAIVEISEISGEQGYLIRVFLNGAIYLYEVTYSGKRFCGEYPSLYDAIITGKSWT